jgi:hypothetical protein
MKGISLVLVLLLVLGLPVICGAQPDEEEEPVQARTLNKVHTQSEAAVVQGTATTAGEVSATPIHLPNPQNQQTEAGKVMSEPMHPQAPHPVNELKEAGTAR